MNNPTVWEILIAIAAVGGFFISLGLAIVKIVKHFRTKEGILEVIFQNYLPALNFTTIGPTLKLMMTLKAEKKDVFVRKMQVEIIRSKDNATHLMGWFLFGDNIRNTEVENFPPLNVYTANSFSVPVQTPKPMEIIFQDIETTEELRIIRNDLIKSYHEWREEKGYDYSDPTSEVVKKAMDEFNKQRSLDFFKRVKRLFYFEPGDYKCILTITIGSGKEIRKQYIFSINQEESKSLDSNCFCTSQLHPAGQYPFSPTIYLKPILPE
jgi:hypothetical protein